MKHCTVTYGPQLIHSLTVSEVLSLSSLSINLHVKRICQLQLISDIVSLGLRMPSRLERTEILNGFSSALSALEVYLGKAHFSF